MYFGIFASALLITPMTLKRYPGLIWVSSRGMVHAEDKAPNFSVSHWRWIYLVMKFHFAAPLLPLFLMVRLISLILINTSTDSIHFSNTTIEAHRTNSPHILTSKILLFTSFLSSGWHLLSPYYWLFLVTWFLISSCTLTVPFDTYAIFLWCASIKKLY